LPQMDDCTLSLLRRMAAGCPIELIELGSCGVRITLNRPEKRNALGPDTVEALTRVFQAVASIPTIRLIVLRGEGDFCAGVDLSSSGVGSVQDTVQRLAELFKALASMPQLRVALVDGLALGAGLGMVAACDTAIATFDAQFGTPEVRRGLIPSVISPYILAAVGVRVAGRLFSAGALIDARKALAVHLVEALVDDAGAFASEEEKLVEQALLVAPEALAETRILSLFAGRPISNDLISETVAMTVFRMASPEAREGLRAFRDKRRPSWVLPQDK